MDKSNLSEWLNKNLKTITHEAFTDVVKISDSEVKVMGDGTLVMISDIKRVILTLETSDGKKKSLKAVAKFESNTGPGKAFADFLNAFETEATLYSEVLKTMEKMLSEKGYKDKPWPDCYHYSDNKFLFQDLCEDNYRIVPTYVFLDREHTLLVMKALGKFHGLSMVMKEKDILGEKRFKEPMLARDSPMLQGVHKMITESVLKNIKPSWGPEWKSVPDRLTNYIGNPPEKLYQLWTSTRGLWDVLNHGDFTLRNMLFHYPPGSSHPDGVKFVDFQMCHYGNLGFDLGQLLYSSLLPSVRDENMSDFLTAYTESLTETCSKLQYSGPTPAVDDVELAVKSMHPFTTTLALFNIPYGLSSNRPDLQEKADEFMDKMTSLDDFKMDDNVQLVDYSNERIEEIIKSELKRCMDQNIF